MDKKLAIGLAVALLVGAMIGFGLGGLVGNRLNLEAQQAQVTGVTPEDLSKAERDELEARPTRPNRPRCQRWEILARGVCINTLNWQRDDWTHYWVCTGFGDEVRRGRFVHSEPECAHLTESRRPSRIVPLPTPPGTPALPPGGVVQPLPDPAPAPAPAQ